MAMPRLLVPALLTVFLDLVGFGIVIPLLPYYAETYGASALQVTLLMAAYSLAQFLFAPVWGGLSDRRGRRPVLLFSIAATAIFLTGFALAESLFMLFVFRTLHGAAAANISTAQAIVADVTPPEKRAMGMGLIGAAFGVGFTVGPWIGGELAPFGYEVPILVAAGLSALNFVLALGMLPETRKASTVTRRRTINPAVFMAVARHPVVGAGVVLTLVVTLAFSMMESTFTLFAEHVWSLDAREVGRMFGIAGLVTIIVQGGLIGRLVKRYGEARLLPVGLVILAVGLALLPFAPPFWGMVGVFAVIAIGQGITSPSLHSLISRATSEDEQGFVLGTNQSMSALARAVGPALGGVIFTVLSPQAPFWASSAILVLSLALALPAVRRLSAPREPDGQTAT